MSIPKKDAKPWLAKKALYQVHVLPTKKINYNYYDVTKPNEQFDQFDLLYVPHNIFEGITYKYILTDVDVASRFKITRALTP